jgi:hypothetical protein
MPEYHPQPYMPEYLQPSMPYTHLPCDPAMLHQLYCQMKICHKYELKMLKRYMKYCRHHHGHHFRPCPPHPRESSSSSSRHWDHSSSSSSS